MPGPGHQRHLRRRLRRNGQRRDVQRVSTREPDLPPEVGGQDGWPAVPACGPRSRGHTHRPFGDLLVMLTESRRTSDPSGGRAMSESLRSLDELRYALDQAAIVAATDPHGVITYVN